MALKDILVHVDGAKDALERIEVAARLAAAVGARLSGFCVRPTLDVPLAAQASGDTRLLEMLERASEDSVGHLQQQFEQVAARHGTPFRWLVGEGELGSAISAAALYSDLVVIGTAEADRARTLGSSVITLAGVPILAVPVSLTAKTPPRRVLVAWNGSRESARAVHHALPLLELAETIEVLIVAAQAPDEENHGVAGAELLDYLSLHGIAAATKIIALSEWKGVATAVLERLGEIDADMIVMGGYGQSRAREVLVGSTTHQILSRSTVPILAAH